MKKRKGFLVLLLVMLLCLTVFSTVSSAIEIPIHLFSTGAPLSTRIISAENTPVASRENFQQEVLLAEAYEDLTYTVKSDDTVEIKGCSTSASGTLVIPDTIDGKRVTSIGVGAFWGCTKLTGIMIPNSVTSIKAEAFYNCSGLTSIIIPDSITSISYCLFWDCSSLTEITIPASVTSIDEGAFKACSSLTSITIPESVTSIGEWAFESCISLTQIMVAESNPVYMSMDGVLVNKQDHTIVSFPAGYTGAYTIPDGITGIEISAFYRCVNLTDITIPDSVISIGDKAFYDCKGLVRVTIGNGVTSIGQTAFAWCDKLTSIVIPDSVTSISSFMFSGCTGLTSVTIPDTVTSIGESVFSGCSSLTDLTLPRGIVSIANSLFDRCSSLTGITVPDHVTNIGDSAFNACTSLSSIIIPDSVTQIGESAFAGCTKLADVYYRGSESDWAAISVASNNTQLLDAAVHFDFEDFPSYLTYETKSDGTVEITGCSQSVTGEIVIPDTIGGNVVTSIGNKAFAACTGLTGISLPDGLTYIGDSAFVGCEALAGVTIPSSVAFIGSNAFTSCTSLSAISVEQSNTSYQSIDGVLFDQQKILLSFPAGQSGNYVIPAGTTAIGDNAFYGCSGLTGVSIPNTIVSIGDAAFYNCTNLVDIIIPDGVISIGNAAFEGCSGIVSAEIGSTVTNINGGAFWNCSSLASLTIPDSVTFIGAAAFEGCSALVHVDISNNATTIGGFAFKGCTSLTDVTIPSSASKIGQSTFYGCTSLTSVTILDGVTSIEISAFKGCTSLSSIIIPDSVTQIGESAFAGCTKLADVYYRGSENDWAAISVASNNTQLLNAAVHFGFEDCPSYLSYETKSDGTVKITGCSQSVTGEIVIPDTIGGNVVTCIGSYAFSDCTGLTSITIPDSVTCIESFAFSGCTGLTNITVPDSVTTIDWSAFTGCIHLSSVIIGNGITEIGDRAFSGFSELSRIVIGNNVASIGSEAFKDCVQLTSATIPDCVTFIGRAAFSRCTSLTDIRIPDGVDYIGNDTFRECTHLTSITIPDSVTGIGDDAFIACTNLANVTIGNRVSAIGARAFMRCTSLTSVIIPDSVTSIGSNAFYSCARLANLTLGNSLEYIGLYAFDFCGRLTSVIIPDSVTSIGDSAFASCGLTSVAIPASVVSIGDHAFCYNTLTSITVAASNPAYRSIDGILMDRQGRLITFPSGRSGSYTLPNSITSISTHAFLNCGLTSVMLPDTVASIDDDTFCSDNLTNITVAASNPTYRSINGVLMDRHGQLLVFPRGRSGSYTIPNNITSIHADAFRCGKLSCVMIPSTVTSIGDQAFEYCYSLQDVYYAGSKSDWEAITIGRYNDDLTSATIHYNYSSAGWGGGSTSDDIDSFNRCIYQANSLQRTSYIPIASVQEELARETYCDRYVASAQENGFDKASALWDACELISDSFDNIKAAYDFVMEPKDIYTAIIMNVLENDVAESVNLINSDYKKGMQSCSKFVSTVKTAMNTLYSIDIMSANDYQNLSAQQMKSLQDLTSAFFKSEYPELVELGDVFTGVTKGIGIVGSIQDYYERVLSCMLVANMSDSLRQVVCQAYTDSRATGNLYLRSALADCVDIVTSSHAELVMKLVTEGISAIGEKAASYLITELFWNGVKGSINTLCPEVAVLQAGFKTGKYISNALTNTDKITAQYSQMLAITDVKGLFDTTCAHLKADFLSAQTEQSAKAYLNAVDLLFAIRLKDCDTAYAFVKEVDSAFIGQFLGHDFSDQLEAIDMAQSRYTASRLDAHTAWIDLLAEDYPGTGLYETYDAIRMSIIENVLSKKYTIACPVDVYVYDQNDSLAAYVEGQRASSSADDITVIRNGEEKSLWFQDDGNYHIEYVGNAAGTMDITVKEYSSDAVETRTVSLYDVPLESSLKYDMAADTETQTGPIYSLSAENGSTIPQDYDSLAGDSVQYKLSVESGNLLQGSELLSSAAVAENETVTLVAYVPEGYRFLYWEASDDSAVFGDLSQTITTVRMTSHDLAVWPVVEAMGSDAFSLTLQQGDESAISVQLTNNSNSATEVLYVLAAYGTSKELITSRTATADLESQQSICLYIPQEYLDRVSEVQAFVLESGTLRPLRDMWSRSY